MPIKINGSTSGSVTLAAPATGSDVTLTLPTTGFGKVLQVVYGSSTSGASTSSTSYTDTGLSATITPSSTSSKVLVIVQQNINMSRASNAQQSMALNLVRGSTQVFALEGSNNTAYGGLGIRAATGANGYTAITANVPLHYLDSPSTTSATTYKTQMKVDTNGGSVDAQYLSAASTMILVEVGP